VLEKTPGKPENLPFLFKAANIAARLYRRKRKGKLLVARIIFLMFVCWTGKAIRQKLIHRQGVEKC
jgi:hypothetical protein